MHLRWKASSPTAKTSSSRRMSASTFVATEKPSRMYMPAEYVRIGRSMNFPSSLKLDDLVEALRRPTWRFSP